MIIAAVVPVWNGREWLGRLFASLARQTHAAAEIIVVDNGSSDGAPELARDRGARILRMGRNAGFAAAVNSGIGECGRLEVKPDWIAVLNSDVELAPDYFEKLSSVDAWFATGKLFSQERSVGATQYIDGTFDAVCRGGTAWRVGSGREDAPLFSVRQPIACAPWTAALFRPAIFGRVGLLDERFESYLEDIDFGLRCAAKGIEGVYEPAAVAWHKGSATLGRWHSETVRRTARNQIYLLARHYPRSLLARWSRPILAAHLLWALVAVRHGTGWAWLRGVRQGLAGFPQLRKAASPINAKVLADLLLTQEHLIRQVQQSTGYDAYWRWYFRLAGGGA